MFEIKQRGVAVTIDNLNENQHERDENAMGS